MLNGVVLHADGSTSDATSSPLGYGIVRAADRAGALELLSDHPLWRSGNEYAIEVRAAGRIGGTGAAELLAATRPGVRRSVRR
jgi:hypothetical protein